MDDIRNLAFSSSRKVPGSDPYRKAWNRWSQTVLFDHVRSDLSTALPTTPDLDATDELGYQLGLAADFGTMPSFGNGGARAGYALAYFWRGC